ncbi:MAG: 50S ribosomal protein L18 [Gammaproteobacteria bacterium]|nr:50S ribosomal protein L18 [Gammaproteobacteria bacterium]
MRTTSSNKQRTRERRVNRSRGKVFDLRTVYLSVHRTAQHIYAQVFAPRGVAVLASASSLEAELRTQKIGPGKLKMAEAVGKLVAERAKTKGITKIAFDRSGYKYHGRVKALAEAARANGLIC